MHHPPLITGGIFFYGDDINFRKWTQARWEWREAASVYEECWIPGDRNKETGAGKMEKAEPEEAPTILCFLTFWTLVASIDLWSRSLCLIAHFGASISRFYSEETLVLVFCWYSNNRGTWENIVPKSLFCRKLLQVQLEGGPQSLASSSVLK